MTATKLIQSITNALTKVFPAGVNLYSASDTEEIELPATIISATLSADPKARGNARAEVEFKVILNIEEYSGDAAVRLIDEIHASIETLTAEALNESDTCHVYFWRWDSTTPITVENTDLQLSFNYTTTFVC